MRKVTVYIYKEKDKTVQTAMKLPEPYSSTKTRLYSDPGMIMKKGNEYAEVIDVENDDVDNWTEVEFTDEILRFLEESCG